MTNKEICDLSFYIERKINNLAGYQDVYGCGVGSFKRIDFYKDKGNTYKFLDISFITKKFHMALINTGLTRKSTKILETIDVEKSKKILPIVDKMEQAINSRNEEEFFKLFNLGWEAKKKTSSEIMSNSYLMELEKSIINFEGVKGLKLCGAGGGGYFLVFFTKESGEKFERYILNSHPKNIFTKVEIETNGVLGGTI